MNVGELKKVLEKYPDDTVVVVSYHSDWSILEPSGIGTTKGVDQNGYVMESHPTMSDDNKAREQLFLTLDAT